MRERPRRKQRGFTLIELMVTVAIIGILASIAIPTFMNYMRKGKVVEAHLAIDKLMKNLRVYQNLHQDLPAGSTGFVPLLPACTTGGKTLQTPQSVWEADPGFKALEFHIDEPGYYQYIWIKASPISGIVEAVADFDCDGTNYIHLTQADIIEGNVFETVIFESSDD